MKKPMINVVALADATSTFSRDTQDKIGTGNIFAVFLYNQSAPTDEPLVELCYWIKFVGNVVVADKELTEDDLFDIGNDVNPYIYWIASEIDCNPTIQSTSNFYDVDCVLREGESWDEIDAESDRADALERQIFSDIIQVLRENRIYPGNLNVFVNNLKIGGN